MRRFFAIGLLFGVIALCGYLFSASGSSESAFIYRPDGKEIPNEVFELWYEGFREGSVVEVDIGKRDLDRIWTDILLISSYMTEEELEIKGVAVENRIFEPMTEERVNYLIIEIVKHYPVEHLWFPPGTLAILERWKAGDFSQVDKDHTFLRRRFHSKVRTIRVLEDRIPGWAIKNQENGVHFSVIPLMKQ